MIKPTVGRVVLFHNKGAVFQPHAAVIVHVHADDMVNLTAFDSAGMPYQQVDVPLLQDDTAPPDGNYAEWMPYQKGQAASTDTKGGIMDRVAALEAKLSAVEVALHAAASATTDKVS